MALFLKEHLILSTRVHSHESPQDPFIGLPEIIAPAAINIIKKHSIINDRIVVTNIV